MTDTDDRPKEFKDGSFHIRDTPGVAKQMAWDYRERHKIPMGQVFERAMRALLEQERASGLPHEIIPPGTRAPGNVHFVDGLSISSIEEVRALKTLAVEVHEDRDRMNPAQYRGFTGIIDRSLGIPLRRPKRPKPVTPSLPVPDVTQDT